MPTNNYKPSPAYARHRYEAAASYAHFKGNPYPFFGFNNSKKALNGGYPTALPFPASSIEYLTNCLFGKLPHLYVDSKDNGLTQWVNNFYVHCLGPLCVRIRDTGGIFGSAFVKFNFDGDSVYPELQVLDCRYFYVVTNPLDREDVEALILRYPVYRNGEHFWYAEVWTKETVSVYPEMKIQNFQFEGTQNFIYGTSVEAQFLAGLAEMGDPVVTENPYGMIPGVLFENKDTPSPFPVGDIFDLRPVIRRIDLVYHLMNLHNQTEAEPIKVFLNCIDQEEIGSTHEPGESLYLQSATTDDGQVLQADARILETQGTIRGYMERYAADMRSMFYERLAVVFPRVEDITNKGNMTSSVFSGMYAPTYLALNRMRVQYGSKGIQALIARILLAGKARGGLPDVPANMIEIRDTLKLRWIDQMHQGAQERLYAIEGWMRLADAGLVPMEVALRKIAEVQEIEDSEEWLNDQTKIAEAKMKEREEAETKKREEKTLPRTENDNANGK